MVAADEQLGPYRIERIVGEGGFGVVYAAHGPGPSPSGDALVAVKVLREELDLTETEVQRFLREAETLAEIHHPGVVSVVDYGQLPDGRPYLVMPLLDGSSLAAVLSKGPLPPRRAVELFLQLADAVAALHGSGLVHRDIKPENVMLVDGGVRALLLDLGIAKRLSDGPSTTTAAGLVRGTPAYMAPERFYGKSASPRSDAYELALMLYVMLAGQPPWDDPTDPVARHRPRPLTAHGFGAALSDVVMRGLAADPKLRPASVEALAEGVSATADVGDPTGPTGALSFVSPPSDHPKSVITPPGSAEPKPASIAIEPTELATVTPDGASPPVVEGAAGASAHPPADRTPPPSSALRPRRSERRWFLAAAGGALIATMPWLLERLTRDAPGPEARTATSAGPQEPRVYGPQAPSAAPEADRPEGVPFPPRSTSASVPPQPPSAKPPGVRPLPPLDPEKPSPAPAATLPGGAVIQPTLPRRHIPAPSCDAWVAWACSPAVRAFDAGHQCKVTKDVVSQVRGVYEILPDDGSLERNCARHFANDNKRVEGAMARKAEREAEKAQEKAEKEARRREREARRKAREKR